MLSPKATYKQNFCTTKGAGGVNACCRPPAGCRFWSRNVAWFLAGFGLKKSCSDGHHKRPYRRSQTPAHGAKDNLAHNGSIKAGGEGLNNFILSGLIGEPKFSVRRLERNVPACGHAPSVGAS